MKKIIPILVVGFLALSGLGSVALNSDIKELNFETLDFEHIGDRDTEYWALLVAVGVYADDPQQNRPLMLEEVDDLYGVLLDSPWWSEDHIKVIKGEDATVLNIIAGLRWLDRMEDSDD
ncbi:MAG: hypothetical protein KAQ84_04510, partial [Thermoplasmatales archaeon]|nr:hypothetical protein [Thermoplasmatales archaeon]